MPSYDDINDEEELMKIMSKTDDFDERKKLRARLKDVREKDRLEREARRVQREKETEDVIRKKHERAEEEKRRKMQQFQEMAAKPTCERESQYMTSTQQTIADKQKQADEDKRKKLEAYAKIGGRTDTKTETRTGADGSNITTTTTTSTSSEKTDGGGTRTSTVKKTETTVSKTSGLGGVQYSKPGAARGGARGGARGAMAAFKQMDATNSPAKPNVGGGRGMARSPSTIKQILLDWAKSKTTEYENIEITNFSSCWNNGLAFCALIHHFFPDAFDYNALSPKNRRYNFDLAFDTAEKMADIAPLLDTEDMVRMKNPDWKCVFTYVQSIYRHLRDHDANKVKEQ